MISDSGFLIKATVRSVCGQRKSLCGRLPFSDIIESCLTHAGYLRGEKPKVECLYKSSVKNEWTFDFPVISRQTLDRKSERKCHMSYSESQMYCYGILYLFILVRPLRNK